MKTSLLVLGVFLLGISHLSAQPFGLSNRVANTTLRMPGTPGVYRSTNAFGTNTFVAPVAIVTPPGETNRVFIVEQFGRIIVLTNIGAANPGRATFLNLTDRVRFGGEQGLLGLAFHPGYATNGYFYVSYIYPPAGTRYGRLSRFQVSASDPNAAVAASEQVLIQQVDDAANHNAGDLHFGSDGYLYMSLGDEGNADDSLNNSQTITKDFYSAIMRIDVDKRPGSLTPNPHPANTNNATMSFNYAIPADNPFVGATTFNGLPVNPANVRTEFWAVGLRNPWRMSFDPVTGYLWCGDVGQNLYEEVDIIVRGGNYG